jgi:hypothetical protein
VIVHARAVMFPCSAIGILPLTDDLPQNKCCSRGTVAPSRHGGRRPTIYGFREFRTVSHGWSAGADHDVA